MSEYWKSKYNSKMGLAIMCPDSSKMAAIVLLPKQEAEVLADVILAHLNATHVEGQGGQG